VKTRREEPAARDVGPEVQVRTGDVTLQGNLGVREERRGLVVFAHGSGSSRFSPRNRRVAGVLQDAGLSTLLLDLLTDEEEAVDATTREYRFDIDRLTRRLVEAVRWAGERDGTRDLRIGCFGSSTGAAAALGAAGRLPELVSAVVSRGGRPDLAPVPLDTVGAPTLLIVGERDPTVLDLNRQVLAELTCEKKLEVVPGATHLFEEEGELDRVAELARDWFLEHLEIREDTEARR
jgi:pimeloyl-ACP methyl ester carboxylesterase